jgi:hypothetical protein
MNFKRVISFGLLCLLLVFGSSTTTLAQENSSTFLENIKLEDIGNHSDIEDYIREQGFEHLLSTGNEKYNFLSEQFDFTEMEKPLILREISDSDIEEIVNELGLKMPEPQEITIEENLLVERSPDNAVSNVWYLAYSTTGSDFSVDILNVGRDKIDSISGTLIKYNKQRQDWRFDSHIRFDKKGVGTGNVFKWIQSKEAVSDYFEYDITVIEDGTTWIYKNKVGDNKFTWQRYNFDASAYSSMDALGGERHHIVAASSLEKAGFQNTGQFPAVRMMYDDHVKTPNWGNYSSSQRFRELEVSYMNDKDYMGLLKFEVNGLKGVNDPEGKYNNLADKYNDYIVAASYLALQFWGVK